MITKDQLDTLAERANAAYASVDGFVACHVESYSPPVLALEMSSPERAAEFQFELEVQQAGRMEIPEGRPSTILQYR